MYSSRSCIPVTSSAPSHTTRSARRSPSPSRNSASTRCAVSADVMSPWISATPSIGAISCRSTAAVRTSSADVPAAACAQPPREHLRPRARRGAQVDRARHAAEEVKLLVDVQQLAAARAPAPPSRGGRCRACPECLPMIHAATHALTTAPAQFFRGAARASGGRLQADRVQAAPQRRGQGRQLRRGLLHDRCARGRRLPARQAPPRVPPRWRPTPLPGNSCQKRGRQALDQSSAEIQRRHFVLDGQAQALRPARQDGQGAHQPAGGQRCAVDRRGGAAGHLPAAGARVEPRSRTRSCCPTTGRRRLHGARQRGAVGRDVGRAV